MFKYQCEFCILFYCMQISWQQRFAFFRLNVTAKCCEETVQSESDLFPARASPSGFAVPYHVLLLDIVHRDFFMPSILDIRHLKG